MGRQTTSAGQRRWIKTTANMHNMRFVVSNFFLSASCLHFRKLCFREKSRVIPLDVIVPLSIQSSILAGAAEATE